MAKRIILRKSKYIDTLVHEAFLHDNESALKELVTYFYPRLYRVAYAVLRDKMLAEEVITDVFFRLWQKRDRYEEIRDIHKYLDTAVKNNALVLLRKEKKRRSENHVFVDDDFLRQNEFMLLTISPEKQYLSRELKVHIETAIRKLPKRCRQVFELVKLDGYSYKQAASELSIKPKTVENQLAIALKKLHAELKPYLNEQNQFYVKDIIAFFLVSFTFLL
ncbi:MAG: sigma-70 family RNA polymerase sigma factor [Cytophagales bacterium]|nr:sigma-70 family RNA polymerase sigma factor [Cytophagales bacterium]